MYYLSDDLITLLRILLAVVMLVGMVYPAVLYYRQKKLLEKHFEQQNRKNARIIEVLKMVMSLKEPAQAEGDEDNS